MIEEGSVAALLTGALGRHRSKTYRFPALGRALTYEELAAKAGELARALAGRGLEPEERVGLLFTTCPEFLVSFVGVLEAGGACMPLPHPSGGRALDAYVARLVRLLESGRVRFVLVGGEFERYAALLAAGLTSRQILGVDQLLDGGPRGRIPESIGEERLALVQYTSGSTSEPKGVALTHANVRAGLHAIIEGIDLGPGDVNGQWLPLHHDMGLIGMLAGTLAGVDHHLWSPQVFIRSPGKWLAEFGRVGATIYAGPNFSYASMLAKTRAGHLAGLNLSRWRVAFNGAEVIDDRTTEEFIRRFEPYGFRRATMFPVYGLAEATLACTFPRLGSEPHFRWLQRDAMAQGKLVPCPPEALGARGLVSVGRAVRDHVVRIVDERGQPLGDDGVGEIQVRGPAVMRHYAGTTAEASGITREGWLGTGDLGFTSEGALYVTGRKKEMIIVRGSNYYPHDIESLVAAMPGVYHARAIAVALSGPAGERIAVLAEVDPSNSAGVDARIREAVLDELGLSELDVFLLKPHSIQRTTSGKYQRLLMRDQLRAGELRDAIVTTSALAAS